MKELTRRALIGGVAMLPVPSFAQTPAPPEALLYIIWPRDGQKVRSPFWVRFGLRNMGVTRAGDRAPNVGHHHLLVDVDTALDPKEPIPTDKKHLILAGGKLRWNWTFRPDATLCSLRSAMPTTSYLGRLSF